MAKKNIKLKWTLLVTYLLVGICPLLIMAQLTMKSVNEYFVEERKKELKNLVKLLMYREM